MNKKHFLPLILLLLIILILYLTNLHKEISLATVQKRYAVLQTFVTEHPYLSPLLFIILYTLSTSFIIPDLLLLTIVAGIFFPWPLAILYCAFSETLGSFIVFSTVRFFGTVIDQYELSSLHKMRLSFQKNSASYLLFLRISHILPFWLINFSAAYFAVPIRTFIWTSFIGILPVTYLLVRAGRDLKTAIVYNASFRISSLFTTQTKLLFLSFGLIALIPVAYRLIKMKYEKKE